MRLTLIMASLLLATPHGVSARGPGGLSRSVSPADDSALVSTPTALMAAYLRSLVASQHFSGVVRVSRGERLLWTCAYGEACREWHVPNTPATAFHIGSISKQFTAAAVLLLQDAGRLGVGDSLGHWLPDAPTAWRSITIHQLLTHTSGIPDLVRLPEFAELATRRTTLDDEIRLLESKPLLHAPGTESHYGNSGYLIAARIVELASGVPFERFLDERIYRPLHMSHSGYASGEVVISGQAGGYVWKNGSWSLPAYLDMSIPVGAGAEYSSAPDLDRYLSALHGGHLLSAKALVQMCTDYGDAYGYGWEVTRVHGHRAIQHTGDINGYGAHVAFFPEGGERIILLSNTQGVRLHTASDSLAAMLFEQPRRP
jgi:CubicO group peptidase (beta-lactamase class C family)